MNVTPFSQRCQDVGNLCGLSTFSQLAYCPLPRRTVCRIHLKYYFSKCEVDQNSCVGWFTSWGLIQLTPLFLFFTFFFSCFHFSFCFLFLFFSFSKNLPSMKHSMSGCPGGWPSLYQWSVKFLLYPHVHGKFTTISTILQSWVFFKTLIQNTKHDVTHLLSFSSSYRCWLVRQVWPVRLNGNSMLVEEGRSVQNNTIVC